MLFWDPGRKYMCIWNKFLLVLYYRFYSVFFKHLNLWLDHSLLFGNHLFIGGKSHCSGADWARTWRCWGFGVHLIESCLDSCLGRDRVVCGNSLVPEGNKTHRDERQLDGADLKKIALPIVLSTSKQIIGFEGRGGSVKGVNLDLKADFFRAVSFLSVG